MDNAKDVQSLQNVLLAGQRVMYDPKTFPMFKNGLLKKAPVATILATETAGLMKMLEGKAQGGLPRQIVPYAALALLIEMAKFMSDSGVAKPTEADIKTAIAQVEAIVKQLYGAGQQQPTQPVPPQQPAMQPPQAGLMGA